MNHAHCQDRLGATIAKTDNRRRFPFWKMCEIECGGPDTSYKNCLVNGHTVINTTAGHHFGPGGSCTGTGGAHTLLVSDFVCYETAVVFTQTGSGQKSLKDCTFSAGVLTAQIVCPTPLKQSTTLTGDFQSSLFEHLPFVCPEPGLAVQYNLYLLFSPYTN